MEILQATVADAVEILTLQKLADQSEAERYNNYNIPPLKQTMDEIKDQFGNHIFLKAVSEGRTIGSVRASEENGVCYIDRLAVDPDSQNRGIGTALMKAIEDYYKPQRFDLFVGSRSDKNIYVYKKLGYTIYKTEKYGCGDIEIFYMEQYWKNI